MRRDDELRLSLDKLMNCDERRQLAFWRECRFRFVKQVQPITPKLFCKKGEEGFTVRLLVKGFSSIAAKVPDLIHECGNIVKAFRSEKVAVFRFPHPSGEANMVL